MTLQLLLNRSDTSIIRSNPDCFKVSPDYPYVVVAKLGRGEPVACHEWLATSGKNLRNVGGTSGAEQLDP